MLLTLIPASAWAADAEYDGSSPALQTITNLYPYDTDVLLPGTLSDYTDTALSTDNSLTVNYSSGSTPSAVYGGYNHNGLASGNHVTYTQGVVTNIVYGAVSARGDAKENSVLVNGGGVAKWVIGAYGFYGNIKNNYVNMTSGTVDTVTGGESGYADGNVTDNRVEWTGGTVNKNVYGGYLNGNGNGTGIASGNSVLVDSVSINHSQWILGAYGNGPVTNNSVTLKNGAVTNIYGGESGNGYDSTENHVTISGGIASYVYGGATWGTGDVMNNDITMTAGRVGSISGGFASEDSGDSSNNHVSVSGGAVFWGIYGGSTNGDGGKANDNSVEISGGTIPQEVIGGFNGSSLSGEATGNTVTLSGNPDMTATNVVFGGFNLSSNGDSFAGNTLNKNSDVSVAQVSSFENINFGYDGDANIDNLDTTPHGSTSTAVNLNTNGNDIYLDGFINGQGGIEKIGAGTLMLEGANSYTGGTVVSEGTLITDDLDGDLTVSGAFTNVTVNGDLTGDLEVSGGTVTITGTTSGTITHTGGTINGNHVVGAPVITTTSLPSGKVGTAYSQTLAATGDAPITWSIGSGNLPNGLSLDTDTGVISGTPTTAGTVNFTVKATNGVSDDVKTLTIIIAAATPIVTGTAPNITATALSGGKVGTAYSEALTATGTTPITWALDSGALPNGLRLDASTGIISGTPTTAGTVNFTVKAANGMGNTTKAFSIIIAAADNADPQTSNPPVSIVNIPASKTPTAPGKTSELPKSVVFSDGTKSDVKWTSANPSIAKIDANGNLAAVGEGKVTLTATSTDGSGKKQTITITVAKPVTKIRTPLTKIYLKKGTSLTPPVCADSINARGKADTNAKITWKSGNPKVATVNQTTGKITAKKPGKTTITATALNGKKLTITVNVVKKAKALKSVNLIKPPKTIKKGKTLQLKINVVPKTATNLAVKFKSSKPSVLKVDKAGKLTAVKKGKAKITVTVSGKKVSRTITVK
jgi:autotransporter-associated beta strand protein